jgi:hypothetical protein
LQDLLAPSSDTSVSDYLAALPPEQREKVLRDLVEEDAGLHDAIKRVMDSPNGDPNDRPWPGVRRQT